MMGFRSLSIKIYSFFFLLGVDKTVKNNVLDIVKYFKTYKMVIEVKDFKKKNS